MLLILTLEWRQPIILDPEPLDVFLLEINMEPAVLKPDLTEHEEEAVLFDDVLRRLLEAKPAPKRVKGEADEESVKKMNKEIADDIVNDIKMLKALPNLVQDDVALALGHATSRWSDVEALLSACICILLSHNDRVGIAITAELSTIQKISLIGALVDCTNDPEFHGYWAEISKKINEIRNFRNDVVHGVWRFDEASPYVLRGKAKGKVVYSKIRFHKEALANLILNEKALAFAIARFTEAVQMINMPEALKNPPKAPSQSSNRPPSHAAQLQAQTRAEKKARKEADRAISRAQKKPGAA